MIIMKTKIIYFICLFHGFLRKNDIVHGLVVSCEKREDFDFLQCHERLDYLEMSGVFLHLK